MKFLVQNQPGYAYTGGQPFDAAKPALIFLHGAANDHSVWHLQARYFAHHGWNVMAVDLPGHGRSAGKPRSTIGEYSQWVVAFLDNANIRTAALVGHSMGSLIALDTAMRAPERVAQLVLMGACVPMSVSEALLNAAKDDPDTAHEMLVAWGHGPTARRGASSAPGLSHTQSNRRLLERAADGVLYNDLSACNDYRLVPDALEKLDMPMLLVTGERDQMTPPKAGAELARMLAGASVVQVPDAGHGVMYECPDAVTDAMNSRLSAASG